MLVDSLEYRSLADAFRSAGWWVQPYFRFGNWYLPVEGRSYADYLKERPGKIRSTIKRKGKKFHQIPGADIQLYRTLDDLPKAMDAYEKVYNNSWKKQEPYPQFIRDLAHFAATKGGLRLGVAWLGDQAIASQLWIVLHGTAYIFKLAYDESHADMAAGTLLTAALMEEVIDNDRVAVIDYLTGDDGYKRDWMSHRREFWGIKAGNPATVRGLLSGVRHRGAYFAKRLLRRGRSE